MNYNHVLLNAFFSKDTYTLLLKNVQTAHLEHVANYADDY